MLAWARRGESRGDADPEVNIHSQRGLDPDLALPLKLLTFNIQVGIQTSRYRHYVTRGWKHVLPHNSRVNNLRNIADLVANYDVVALQEIDTGSLRSGFVNQVEYLADRAQFPFWYAQLNRDLGMFAQHGNGLLSRVEPLNMEDHKLPGAIPGRGAIIARVPYAGEELLIVLLHLSLGERSRQLQLEYVAELIGNHELVVVMGDMNSHLSQVLHRSPLKHSNLQPVADVQPSYPAWRPSLALDHILASPSLRFSEYEVLDCRLSDHRPISVNLELAA